MNKTKVIFFTGAGISVESGIPTFEQQPDLRECLSRSFANEHPDEYKKVLKDMVEVCNKAKPNAAHTAIAQTEFPVITMNVDGLHTKAGSSNVIEVHGILPTMEELEEEDFVLTYDRLVLYGDLAPKYEEAVKLVKSLEYGNSYFIAVGTSFYTGISEELLRIAKQRHAHIMIINENACEKVPTVCENMIRIVSKECEEYERA